jgi:hypothetical protein
MQSFVLKLGNAYLEFEISKNGDSSFVVIYMWCTMWEKYKTCNVLWKKLGLQIVLLMHVQIGENYIFFSVELQLA